jgi:hypothetical protein
VCGRRAGLSLVAEPARRRPLAGGAGAGPAGQQGVQPCGRLPHAQADATGWAVQPLQSAEAMGDRDQDQVVMPATEAAALDVVQAKHAVPFPVVLLDPPSQLAQPDQLQDRVPSGRFDLHYLTGSALSFGPSASSQRTGSFQPAPSVRPAAWRPG